ncbi:MAG: hypothetical protein AB7P22_05960, partial [Vicinamibacterales bacterium]
LDVLGHPQFLDAAVRGRELAGQRYGADQSLAGLAAVRAALELGFGQALLRMSKYPDYLKTAETLGIDVSYVSADDFEKQIREEDKAFKALVTELGLTPK